MEDASASNVDWISPDDTNSKSKRDSIMQPSENVSLSQRIAKVLSVVVSFPTSAHIVSQACVLYLPPPAGQPPRFTIGRSKEVVQRLYLSVAPIYGPFLARIGALATWKDWNASCFWCSVCDLYDTFEHGADVRLGVLDIMDPRSLAPGSCFAHFVVPVSAALCPLPYSQGVAPAASRGCRSTGVWRRFDFPPHQNVPFWCP